jgi:hypothetical protein
MESVHEKHQYGIRISSMVYEASAKICGILDSHRRKRTIVKIHNLRRTTSQVLEAILHIRKGSKLVYMGTDQQHLDYAGKDDYLKPDCGDGLHV